MNEIASRSWWRKTIRLISGLSDIKIRRGPVDKVLYSDKNVVLQFSRGTISGGDGTGAFPFEIRHISENIFRISEGRIALRRLYRVAADDGATDFSRYGSFYTPTGFDEDVDLDPAATRYFATVRLDVDGDGNYSPVLAFVSNVDNTETQYDSRLILGIVDYDAIAGSWSIKQRRRDDIEDFENYRVSRYRGAYNVNSSELIYYPGDIVNYDAGGGEWRLYILADPETSPGAGLNVAVADISPITGLPHWVRLDQP